MVVSLALLALLFAGMLYDLRDRSVPMTVTAGGLIAAGLISLFKGLWAPVLLLVALMLVSDFELRIKRLAFGITITAFCTSFQLATAPICALILSVWLLWEFDVMGGADVKLIASAALIFSDPLVIVPIMAAGGVQGVIAAIQKKKEIPFVASIFCGTLLFVLYPFI